jgi:hypothetical protein
MTNKDTSNFEKDYKAVLVRKETKEQLRDLRTTLPDRDLYQERRLATAGLEMIMDQAKDCPDTRDRLLTRVRDIVRRDLDSQAAL